MAEVSVSNLSHAFGGTPVLDDVSFDIRDGEFFTLVGPSGCGKSTTLTALSGLLTPDRGRIVVGSEVFLDTAQGVLVRPERRNIGLMFQSYALWPHMTVQQNVAFALRIRGIGKADRERRVEEALNLVEMGPYLSRYPGELSGGQQQRVALARTLAYGPSVLLLDEPLSNLDAKLRDRARVWLRALQQRMGITTVYVTHDQSEALSLSDRLAILDRGKIVQLGPPQEVYQKPASRFVADFVGKINVLEATVEAGAAPTNVRLDSGEGLALVEQTTLKPGDRITLGLRPERIKVVGPDETVAGDDIVLAGAFAEPTFEGARFVHPFQIGNGSLRVESVDRLDAGPGRIAVPRSAFIWLRA